MPKKHHFTRIFALSAAVISQICVARDAESTHPPTDILADLSLEQLLNVKVTSVAKREETLSDSPAAVYVVTQDAIRRSGATNIPEALRLVPGMNVAQVDAHTWAISARGFNDVFANKLLVLIDGRTVYTPLFSGVFWDSQDVMMADVDRIEVIRGPGASLWGANAVNGVINVITKRAAESQGLHAAFGGGNEKRAFGEIRFGGMLGENVYYRIWGKAFNQDDLRVHGRGTDGHDGWESGRGGFRIDIAPTEEDLVTFQGQIYANSLQQTYIRLREDENFTPYRHETQDGSGGGHILGRWTHQISDTSEFTLQTYYDRAERRTVVISDQRETFDIDFQHRFAVADWQTLTWGAGYRRDSDRVRNTFDIELDPAERTTDLLSAFIQDEISLIPNRLSLTIGSKFEHNDYTGFEVQPSIRILAKPDEEQTIWASVSRAVRTPSRAESDITLRQQPVIARGALFAGLPPFVPPSPAVLTSVYGSDELGSEKLIAYELGYRAQPHERFSLDVALFFNDYDELRSIELVNTVPDFASYPPSIDLMAGNKLRARAYGGEIAATWRATDWLRLQAHYSYLEIEASHTDSGNDTAGELFIEGASPEHQVSLHASIDVTRNVEFDAIVRWVDELPALGIDPYVTLDLRVAWRPSDHVEVSIVGRNLLDQRHPEFLPTSIATLPMEVETSIFGQVTIRF